jgi:serralysin
MCTICVAMRPEVPAGECAYSQLSLYYEGSNAPDTVSTTYTVMPGSTFLGTIKSLGDRDWVAVTFEADTRYEIMLDGRGGVGGLNDPYLRIYDADGNPVAWDDDGGKLLNARLVVEDLEGTYYLAAGAYADAGTGEYTLTVVETSESGDVVFTLDQIADYLTDGYWADLHGAPWRAFDLDASRSLTVNLTGLTEEGARLARWALEAWSDITGISFVETDSGDADILFTDHDPGAFAQTTYIPATNTILQSRVNVSADWLNSYGTTIDSYSFQTYIHEIGHALGLGHSGNYSGWATFGVDNHYMNDSWQASVMSYFSQWENTFITASFAFVITPMIADIIAAHNLYGAGTSDERLGDTVYGVNGTLSGYLGLAFDQITGVASYDPDIWDGSIGVTFTIYDPSGYNTINLSHDIHDQHVDLRPEGISDVNGLVGNMIIARDTVIREYHGGSGDDFIRGNSEDNVLYGGEGNDTIVGAMGDDLIFGGPGDDVINGGPGHDTLYGGEGDDRLRGGGGRDLLYGGPGNDLLIGDAGNDTLHGGPGNDKLFGGMGNDLLVSGPGRNLLNGGPGDDTLIGGGNVDTLRGGSGNDVLTGGGGADIFVFRAGYDNNIITDFELGLDRLFLNTDLWPGDLTPDQVLSQFGSVQGEDFILDFGPGGTVIILQGINAEGFAQLADDILITG